MKIITSGDLKFMCEHELEVWRVETLFTKEEGTISWIKNEVNSGDVFYDVGANIGIYALFAALKIGLEGMVYAFEPNVVNAYHLFRNIHINKLENKVKLITSALHNKDCFLDFNYQYLVPGSSGSQFGHTNKETGGDFIPSAIEIKHGTTIDRLIEEGAVLPPTHIKIDVDGNELLVLHGMKKILSNPVIKTIQVEMHPKDDESIREFLLECRFPLSEKHYTELGKQALNQGIDPKLIAYNSIFKRC